MRQHPHLLHEHDNFGSDQSPTVSWYSDKFKDLTLADFHVRLSIKQGMHVVHVTSSLDLAVPKLNHGTVCFAMAALANVPAGRLRAQEDEADDDQSREHCGSHHETPIETGDVWRVRDLVEYQVGDVAEHDAKSGPHLPLHDQSTTDGWRSGLSSVDRNRRGFRPDTEAKAKSSNEHVPPSVDETLPEAGQSREGASDKDSTTTAKPMIERNGQPAADKCTAEVRCGIDEP